ncbi:MAG: hypothetical protein JJT96_20625 [Opitutales bacterium]|nr:hypothetical protein [Opitutales bacterium]
MQENTDRPSGGAGIFRIREITDFELSIACGLYWIAHEDRNYPVILTPHHLKRLFEIEGLPIEDFTGDESARFRKVILQRREGNFGGDLFDEQGDDITPQRCWVKEADEADAAEP